MSSILTRLLEKGLPTRDVQIATTGEQQQRPLKFEGAQDGNIYNGDLLVIGGQDDEGYARHLNLDSAGRLVITGQSSGGGTVVPMVITGENEDPADSNSKPLLISGRYDAVPRNYMDGQMGALAMNSEGKLMIDIQNASLTATVNVDIDNTTDSIQMYATDGLGNRAIKSDNTGRLVMVGAVGSGSFVAGNPVLGGGSDDTGTARTFATDRSGRQIAVGAADHGTAVTGSPVLIAGSDGTNAYRLQTDNTGRLFVAGSVADGASVFSSGNPVVTGARGTDNNVHNILSDGSGRQIMVGHAASGAAATGYPVLISGSDGSVTRTLKTDGTGQQIVVGAAASGAVVAGNPLLIGGQDGTNVRTLQTNTLGALASQPKLTSRIHQQRCFVNATDGSTDSRIVHMRFTGVYTFTTQPFLTALTADTLTMTATTNVAYDINIRVYGIGVFNEELEETMLIPSGGTSSAASVNTYKNINDIKMLTSMHVGNNIFGALGANPECFEVGANYHENPFFMCPEGYKARLKGLANYYASTTYTIGLQVYAENSSALIPGLYFTNVSTSTTQLTFPEPGAYELTAGQGVYWVADGNVSGTCTFTALWELIPL